MQTSPMAAIARFVVFVLALGWASPALAQGEMSPAELRRSLEAAERLAAERLDTIEALRGEIAGLRQQIARLSSQLEGLSRTPIEAPSGQIPPQRATGAVPSDPLASPSSLFFALQASYAQAMEPPRGQEDRELTSDRRRRIVQGWARTARRDFSGRSAWIVRFVGGDDDGLDEGGRRMEVLNRESLLPIGSPIQVDVPRRFRQRIDGSADGQLFELSLRVTAQPVFNTNRAEPGVFNFPLLIGPYAEFGFDLTWDRLLATTPVEIGKPDADG